MDRKRRLKLNLNRETIRHLTVPELRRALGGDRTLTATLGCPTATCVCPIYRTETCPETEMCPTIGPSLGDFLGP